MADKKISALTALTAANVAPATDVVPIVDTSATETKKVTAKDLVDGALNGGTANGVLYLNGSKAATSGSALVFDGTNLGIGTSSPDVRLRVDGASPTRGIIETVRGTGSTGSQIHLSQDGVADWAWSTRWRKCLCIFLWQKPCRRWHRAHAPRLLRQPRHRDEFAGNATAYEQGIADSGRYNA